MLFERYGPGILTFFPKSALTSQSAADDNAFGVSFFFDLAFTPALTNSIVILSLLGILVWIAAATASAISLRI